MKSLWCKLVGHKWKRRYYPGLNLEMHECRRCADIHTGNMPICKPDCYHEPAAIL